MTHKANHKTFAIDEDRPADWFEPLYASANTAGDGVPWATMDTHPAFRQWLSQHTLAGTHKRALVVGCGMGDDAIQLEKLGFDVTAFDVSTTAIHYCNERFPESAVEFVQADLLQEHPGWHQQFDFVLEIYTVQALPPKFEAELIRAISGFVAAAGTLLVIAEVGNTERSFENGPPWLLTPQHIDSFIACGLTRSNSSIQQGSVAQGESKTFVTAFSRPPE